MLNEILMTNVLQSLCQYIADQTNYLLDHGLMSSKVAEGFESVKVHLDKLKKYQEHTASQVQNNLNLHRINKKRISSPNPTTPRSLSDEEHVEEGELKRPKKIKISVRRRSNCEEENINSQNNTICTIRKSTQKISPNEDFDVERFVEKIDDDDEIPVSNVKSVVKLDNEDHEIASDDDHYKGMGKYHIFKGAEEYIKKLKRRDVRAKQNKFICKYCKLCCKNLAGLKKHLILHTAIRPFKCETCDATFRRKEHMKAHMSTHALNRKSIICNVCNRGFSSLRSLKSHQKTVHGKNVTNQKEDEELPGYYCDLCSFGFVVEEHFRKHIAKHTEEDNVPDPID